jgi:hypothetical protein
MTSGSERELKLCYKNVIWKLYKIHRVRSHKPNFVAWVREWTIPTEWGQLVAKLMPIFTDTGCQALSLTYPYRRILGFLDRSHYFFCQVAPQLYSRGWVDHFQDPPLIWKSSSAGNRTQTSASVPRNSDH